MRQSTPRVLRARLPAAAETSFGATTFARAEPDFATRRSTNLWQRSGRGQFGHSRLHRVRTKKARRPRATALVTRGRVQNRGVVASAEVVTSHSMEVSAACTFRRLLTRFSMICSIQPPGARTTPVAVDFQRGLAGAVPPVAGCEHLLGAACERASVHLVATFSAGQQEHVLDEPSSLRAFLG